MQKKTIGLLVLGVVVLVAITYWVTRDPPLAVALATVERGDVRWTVSNTRAGSIDVCNRARMAPILGGQIAKLPVSEGDQVHAGQVLLELWNDDLQAQLHLAEQEREAASARVTEACTSADVAQREARRIESLRARALTSEESADLARGEAKAKSARCNAMRSMVQVSDAQIELARARLERTIVRAPFAGTIAEINGEIGEVVTPSPVGIPTLPAVDLIDGSCIFVSAPIDEVDAPSIRAGMKASVSLDAFPDKLFPATVTRVAPYVLSLEKQARTVEIEAEFDEPSANLLPGYSADIEIVLGEHLDVLRIPTQSVISGDKVLVLNDSDILEERVIKTGLRNWQVTEVLAELEEGDQVVLSVDRAGIAPGVVVIPESR